MKIAFVMDAIESININTDSTFVLMLLAQQRGHEIYYCEIADLFMDEEPGALMKKVWVERSETCWKLLDKKKMKLKEFNVIFMRKDPPVDQNYIYATYILELASQDTFIINNPSSLRSYNEKLCVFHFSNLTPLSIVSADKTQIRDFQRRVGGKIVVKPIYGHGGKSIFIVDEDDLNQNSLIEMLTEEGGIAVVAQKYLPESRNGDKRIILFNGEPLGAVLRVPQNKDLRANLHVGGQARKTDLTKRDLEICNTLRPWLAKNGLYFTGIDVIGDFLIEINITSPTGIQEINRLNDVQLETTIMSFVELKS